MSSPITDKGKRQCPFVLYCFTSAVPSTPGGSLNYDDVFFMGAYLRKYDTQGQSDDATLQDLWKKTVLQTVL